jgi:two-component system sensor histidine kinase HupT/HoxJ
MDNYVFILLFVTLIATLTFAFFTRKKQKSTLYSLFRVLFLLLSLHVVALILLFYFKDIILNMDTLMYIDAISYISTCNLPVILFFISSIYENKETNLKKYWYLFIIPILSIIIIFTNPLHHLFCKSYAINVADVQLGPYFYVHMLYTYLLILVAFIKLIKTSISKAGFLSFGTILIILGACAPIIPNLLASLQLISMDTYITPIPYLITAICFYISIFKLNSFDAVPIALKNIVDIMTDAFIVVEKDGTITYSNNAFNTNLSKMIGIKLNDNFYNIINTNKKLKLSKLNNLIKKSEKNNTVETFDWSFNSEKYFEISAQPVISTKGRKKVIGTLIIFKDTTQHMLDMQTIKNNQDMLLERERLASLGQLIGGIAHNLKTPIMSISGAAEGLTDLVKEYEASVGDPEVTVQDHHDIAKDMKDWIEKIHSYTEYMSDIITAVKGQAVTMSEEQAVSFTLDELVKRVNILMKHELKNALVELNVSMQVNEQTVLKGNINSLVQVINNMISNAIQAYDGKPDNKIDLILKKENNNIIISVKDYGCGLPDEVQKKLFKEMITTKGKNGTGLGLFMSYSTIRAHFNGNMTFETEQGKGTTFNIILPL